MATQEKVEINKYDKSNRNHGDTDISDGAKSYFKCNKCEYMFKNMVILKANTNRKHEHLLYRACTN